ncbi:hypothetical protein [Streptomyces sp. NPDC101455]|uniref:hypothetical protein n=1 Tax=Streptomyces sp. NPDC101455 TaxID=3366142 RepID=UPI003824B832
MFPVAFELAHDQAVLRLGEPVGASGPVGFGPGAFQPLGPDRLDGGPVGQVLLGGLDADLDGG